MSKSILGPDGRPIRPVPIAPRRVVARYDAAQTTPENSRHWAEADNLSSRAANIPDVRLKLRTRARYEVANNSYARGIVETLANDTIGTGPRLQLLGPDPELNREIEHEFTQWTKAVHLADKLRTARKARAQDGEAFILLATNPKLPTDVKLDPRLIEADQITTPYVSPLSPLDVDGIEFDEHENPLNYHLLKYHPGDALYFGYDYEKIPARLMLHWFRADRPGQRRGIPDITPALPLFAYLRRYTLATISAAEIAASFAAMLQSSLPPGDESAEGEAFETLEIARGMMTTLPAGYTMAQLRAEHPTTTYAEFKREILNEIARCLNMPFNVAAGNSSSYNYASGRLDHKVYYKSIVVDQAQVARVVLDPIFEAWLAEAALATKLIPRGMTDWPHQWFWDGDEHVDPMKEASAQATRLASRTTTYAREFARQGRDWDTEFRQIAAEQRLMAELGISVAQANSAISTPPPSNQPSQDPSTDPYGDGNDPTAED